MTPAYCADDAHQWVEGRTITKIQQGPYTPRITYRRTFRTFTCAQCPAIREQDMPKTEQQHRRNIFQRLRALFRRPIKVPNPIDVIVF
ncbi:hypothetical protein A5780_19265 [Nocardia sp. 852002-20019_SCH5090214]|uniref:hypothetical protein n=1 Tax=Nocardia sp. 852002-20019_SCH5090214 TaxID=1834087 RepID=UPI0007E9BA3C|nr:hypothetical protein [Nocardia sp. 852002-20019_SCH5090214]OBA62199.1 hypothetical protein A5780_19265 [Nocardia sp. 852002-20019_SCH5090214]